MDRSPRKPTAALATTSGENPESGELLLSDQEKRVLELYDQLQQLQLEIALINAHNSYVPGRQEPQSIEAAQEALLETRAKYVLRNDVAESVLSVKPVLQAVHAGSRASPIERDLLPVVQERDATSTTLAQQSTELRATLDDLTETEAKVLRLSRENVDLASEVLELAAEEKRQRDDALISNPAHREAIAQLEAQVRISHRRWRVMKGTASAIVAGSGVDWAQDEGLRRMVLDEDEDGV
ncbi:Centromere protein Cenp-H [Apiospora marii]|uniref:Centromere protein Cenp-H n=1 Tax=Apiospora marii TaxID=335849 RepID=UPI00312F402A